MFNSLGLDYTLCDVGWASKAKFPLKEFYSPVMRFFEGLIKDVQLYFWIEETLQDVGVIDWFKCKVNKVIDEAIKPNGCVLINYEVNTFSPDSVINRVFEIHKTLLGCHSIGLYEIWADTLAKPTLLNEGVLLPTFAFSNGYCEVTLKENQVKLNWLFPSSKNTLYFPKATSINTTQTDVTPLKTNAARNKGRVLNQNKAIGDSGTRFVGI